MAYGAALERRFGGNSIEGSNPSLSANLRILKNLEINPGFLIDQYDPFDIARLQQAFGNL